MLNLPPLAPSWYSHAFPFLATSKNFTMAAWDQILSRLNKDALLAVACSLAGGSHCHLDGSPILRTSWAILIVQFPSESKRWAARIPIDQECSFLETSVQPLEFVARNYPDLPAPRLHGYVDAGTLGDNPVGVAYMLVDWLEGRSMKPWDLNDPPVSVRRKVLDQVADIVLEMLSRNAADDHILFYGSLAF